MKKSGKVFGALSCVLIIGGGIAGLTIFGEDQPAAAPPAKMPADSGRRVSMKVEQKENHVSSANTIVQSPTSAIKEELPRESPALVKSTVNYILGHQKKSGGWGSGKLYAYETEHVKSDPGTTSFVGLSLLRSGIGLDSEVQGRNPLRKALKFMLNVMDHAKKNPVGISNDKSAQPLKKIGNNTDLCFASMFFSRALAEMNPKDSMYKDVKGAAEDCIRRIQKSQAADGSWPSFSWAPVFQTALGYVALDYSEKAGLKVSRRVMEKAKEYILEEVNSPELYSYNKLYYHAAALRMFAEESRNVHEVTSRFSDSNSDSENIISVLVNTGIKAEKATASMEYCQKFDTIASSATQNNFLTGFGSYGGEEFISYFLISEANVITNEERIDLWVEQILSRLKSIQTSKGYFEGQHCITSTVFCTAAALLTITAHHDKEFLVQGAKAESGS